MRNVLLKLARGHALYELNEPMLNEPDYVSYGPIHLMSNKNRQQFEDSPIEGPFAGWQEVGSRAMQRLLTGQDMRGSWIIVQDERYRYQAVAGGFVSVKMVLRDYLAAEVIWDS